MGALDDLIRQDEADQGGGDLAKLIAEDNAQTAAPRGGGAVYSEPDPSMKVDDRSWIAKARDEDDAANGGVNPIERFAQAAVGAGGSLPVGQGLGRIGSMVGNVASGGAQAGLAAYRDDPDHDVFHALLEGGKGALASAALAGGGQMSSLAGQGAQAVGNRARMAATNATTDDLRALGMSPQQFSDMTDRAGLNNKFLPVSRAGKLGRADAFADAAGQRQAAEIGAADQAGIGQHRDWGGEIARDVDQNADNVRAGGSGQRGPIMSQMRNVADAADAHPMNSLADLRAYKTARGSEAYANNLGGINESAAGKAALAGHDSASQHLDQAMSQAGPESFGRYQQANQDFGDASTLQELLSRKPQQANLIGDVAAGTIGTLASGGNPMGVAGGIAARRIAAPYAADMTANVAQGAGRGMQGAGSAMTQASPLAGQAMQQWMGQKGVRMDQPPPSSEAASQNSNGGRLGDVAAKALQQNPQALGQYAQQFQDAMNEGPDAVNALVGKLDSDPAWRQGPKQQLLQMTGTNSGN